jgi:hypothetical protein
MCTSADGLADRHSIASRAYAYRHSIASRAYAHHHLASGVSATTTNTPA